MSEPGPLSARERGPARGSELIEDRCRLVEGLCGVAPPACPSLRGAEHEEGPAEFQWQFPLAGLQHRTGYRLDGRGGIPKRQMKDGLGAPTCEARPRMVKPVGRLPQPFQAFSGLIGSADSCVAFNEIGNVGEGAWFAESVFFEKRNERGEPGYRGGGVVDGQFELSKDTTALGGEDQIPLPLRYSQAFAERDDEPFRSHRG
ncbi:hypothetical protein ACFQX6_28130 [Streptosporangium lutulentum]